MKPIKGSEAKDSRLTHIYQFFVRLEEEDRATDFAEIVRVTGYEIGTARTYIAKKWDWFLTRIQTGGYIVKGLKEYSLKEFLHRHKHGSLPETNQLVIRLPLHLMNWLETTAKEQACSIDDLIIDVLEHHQKT